jgi:hypothetical protein
MKQLNYIPVYNFVGLNLYELLVMSLIYNYHRQGMVVCPSNEYIANKFRTHKNTITRTITSLKTQGFIEITITPTKRFIKVLRVPEILELSDEVCELEDDTNTHLKGYTSHPTGEGVSPDRLEGITPQVRGSHLTGEHIVKKIIKNNKEESSSVVADSYPPDFLSFVEDYGDEDTYLKLGFELWNELSDSEKSKARSMVQAYFTYSLETNKSKKPLHFYLKDSVWTWGSVIRVFKRPKPKPVLTNEDKLRMFDEQNPNFGEELKKYSL